jgi:hypothetical protein
MREAAQEAANRSYPWGQARSRVLNEYSAIVL